MATRTDMYGILISEVIIEEGFNVRYDMGNLQELADSIVENGIQNPIHAYTKKGDINRYTLIEGHRRIAAVQLAIKQGKLNPLEFRIPMVKGRNLSDIDRTYGLVTFNSGKNLTMLEEATVYDRLVNYGATATEIAKKVGKSPTHITNCLTLISANIATKKMVMDNVVTATLVIDLLKKKEPKEVEAELKTILAEKRNAAKEEHNVPAPAKKDNAASEDVPSKQDNTKTSGADTRTLPEEKAKKAVRITKKDLSDTPNEKKYGEAFVVTMMEALLEECKAYQTKGVPIDIDATLWFDQNKS